MENMCRNRDSNRITTTKNRIYNRAAGEAGARATQQRELIPYLWLIAIMMLEILVA